METDKEGSYGGNVNSKFYLTCEEKWRRIYEESWPFMVSHFSEHKMVRGFLNCL